jgi:hypothetical protein
MPINEFLVETLQKLDNYFPDTQYPNQVHPHSYMIARYALKQLIYELDKNAIRSKISKQAS